jgi:DNA-binding GntR family transcriptional regulator
MVEKDEAEEAGGDALAVPLAERVYRALLAKIRDGELTPGERIKEVTVAREMKISRTPVREAIRRLQSEGRVTIEPQRGAMVAELDRREISELYLLRMHLEGIAARFAAQYASDVEIEQMVELLALSHAHEGDRRMLNRLNWNLHHAIYFAARNRFLSKVMAALSDDFALMRGTRYIPADRPKFLHDEHQAIIDAIRARDPDAADAAAQAHIRNSYRIHLKVAFDNLNEDE